LKQDDLIIHYHCLITISELNNDSFLTVSGDSEIISYVHIIVLLRDVFHIGSVIGPEAQPKANTADRGPINRPI
jgi:hypothetical protein